MILDRALSRIRGGALVFVEERYKSGFLRMLVSEGIPAKVWEEVENEEKRGIKAMISPKFTKKIISLLDKYSIKVYIINIVGYYTFFEALGRRLGVIVGAVTFIAIVWLSSRFIWRVDIVGATGASEESLREALMDVGVGLGARVSDIDAFAVANSLLVSDHDISWASLQLKGTVATLTVRETVEHQGVEENRTSLLVASEGGVVQSVLVYKGTSAVKVGSVVKAGDALINGLLSGSGLQYSDEPILRIGEADGSVKAIVERELSVTVPYVESELIPKEDGLTLKRRRITLFGGMIDLGDGEPTEGERFSISEARTAPTVFGAVLPVSVTETVWSELAPITVERTAEEAESTARARARERLLEDARGDEIVYAEYTARHDGETGAVTVTVIYRCVTEIAISADIGK